MKKIFSILIVFTLVIIGTVGTTGIGVSAAETNSTSTSYDSITIQKIYEEIMASDDPSKAFAALDIEIRHAILRIYAPEAWEELNNIYIEKTTKITTKSNTKDVTETTISVYVTRYSQGVPISVFCHEITWAWDGVYINWVQSGQWGIGNDLQWTKWVYSYNDSYGNAYLAPDWTYYTRQSYGHFDVYVWFIDWIWDSHYTEYAYSRVEGDGDSY